MTGSSFPACAAGSPPFASFRQSREEARLAARRRRRLVAVSLGVHASLLAVWAARPSPPPILAPPAVVASLFRPGELRRREPAPTPAKAIVRQRRAPTPRPRQPMDLPPPAVEQAGDETAGEDAATEGAEGGEGAAVAGIAPPPPPPTPPPAPPRMSLAQYLREQLRPRFESRFSYPPEAERLGVEGTVVLRLTIESDGRLRAVTVAGPCPSEILCEHARRVARAASPFPPPPAAPGTSLQIELPIGYRLD